MYSLRTLPVTCRRRCEKGLFARSPSVRTRPGNARKWPWAASRRRNRRDARFSLAAPENAQPMVGSRPRYGLEEKNIRTDCRRRVSLPRARCIYAVLGVTVAQVRYRVNTCPRAPAIPRAHGVQPASSANFANLSG